LSREWRPRQSATVERTPAPRVRDERVIEIQRELAALGFDPGPADGVLGPRTRSAIGALEARVGLPVTGEVSDELVSLLRELAAEQTAPTPSKPEIYGQGSGFFVSGEGHVVSNYHVVEPCREIRLTHLGKVRQLAADAESDLVLLKTATPASSYAAFRQGRGIRTGDKVIVAGFPLQGLLASDVNVTVGNVSALAGPGNDRRLMQITAPVQAGNSGGPVLDEYGNVVGVVVGKADALKLAEITGSLPENVNFAISRGTVQAFLDAYNVPYETALSDRKLDTGDVAAKAQPFTVLVECWR